MYLRRLMTGSIFFVLHLLRTFHILRDVEKNYWRGTIWSNVWKNSLWNENPPGLKNINVLPIEYNERTWVGKQIHETQYKILHWYFRLQMYVRILCLVFYECISYLNTIDSMKLDRRMCLIHFEFPSNLSS